MASRDEQTEEAANALQAAILHADEMRLVAHDTLSTLGKLRAELQRAVAALHELREKGGA
jgi:hypothetical protein